MDVVLFGLVIVEIWIYFTLDRLLADWYKMTRLTVGNPEKLAKLELTT